MESQTKTRDLFGAIIKIGIILLTGFKTIDLMMSTLPADQKWLGIAGVFTVDIALLYWDHYCGDPHLAKCREQRFIGAAGIIANMVAILVIMVADSARFVAPGQFDQFIVLGSVIGLAVIAVINLSLGVAAHQFDPDRQLEEEMAKHQREMALLKKKNAQELEANRTRHLLESEKDQQSNDLEIERLAHRQRLNKAKEDYMRNNGIKQSAPAAPLATMASDSPEPIEEPAKRGRPKKSG